MDKRSFLLIPMTETGSNRQAALVRILISRTKAICDLIKIDVARQSFAQFVLTQINFR
jgi:hypothetical protein